MAIEVPRILTCGCCGRKEEEPVFGDGWPEWGQMKGVVLNGVKEPFLCPACLHIAMDALDARAA